ncbi:scramblase family protein [Diplodia corticola]|uniref:Scramblase family protein n=1 Tax=Diplodia corticola TaxID=236234 RepID=A0A1J9S046_9PEZI|nr:scramblase family protein [Diplodia corticola]OJD33396.1 scramblase family protein [Diplodia corticola]
MPLIRLSARTAARTVTLRTPTRTLSTSSPLCAAPLRKQHRAWSKPGASTRQPLGRTPAGRVSGIPRKSNPEPTPAQPNQPPEQPENVPSRVEAVSAALRESAAASEGNLQAPVNIPDDPHSVLKPDHPAMSILANSTIVVQRQLEMMNVLLGFEQANRYVIMDGQGNHIGYLAEQENGLGSSMARQMFKTHRSFTTHVFDKHEREVLRFHRPFSYINSKIRIYDCINGTDQEYASSDALNGTSVTSIDSQTSSQISQLPLSAMRVIGEAQQQWAPLRRKYNLFLARDPSTLHPLDSNTPQITSGDLPLSSSTALQPVSPSPGSATAPDHQSFLQFAYVNEPWLSWDFTLRSDSDQLLGSVNRNFGGLAREVFTDTGVYALRMDAAALAHQEPQNLISDTTTTTTTTTTAQQQQNQGDAEKGMTEQQQQQPGMTLDQRAVMLATAVSIDFDYFSRHSGAGGGFFGMPIPIWFPGGGGGAAAEGAAAEGAAAGGAAEGAVTTTTAAGEEGVGAAAAGAGTMVGYEAMQRSRAGAADDASPVAGNNEPWAGGAQPPGHGGGGGGGQQQGGEVWGEQDPWSGWGKGDGGGPPTSGGSSGGGGGDGGGDGFDWTDLF